MIKKCIAIIIITLFLMMYPHPTNAQGLVAALNTSYHKIDDNYAIELVDPNKFTVVRYKENDNWVPFSSKYKVDEDYESISFTNPKIIFNAGDIYIYDAYKLLEINDGKIFIGNEYQSELERIKSKGTENTLSRDLINSVYPTIDIDSHNSFKTFMFCFVGIVLCPILLIVLSVLIFGIFIKFRKSKHI